MVKRAVGNEAHVAREPVHLGDDQLGVVQAAHPQRFLELGPVIPLPALNLHEFRDQRPGATIQVVIDCLPLCLKAQAPPWRSVLTLRVRDEPPPATSHRSDQIFVAV